MQYTMKAMDALFDAISEKTKIEQEKADLQENRHDRLNAYRKLIANECKMHNAANRFLNLLENN